MFFKQPWKSVVLKGLPHYKIKIFYFLFSFFFSFFVGVWSLLADKLHFILSYEVGFLSQPSSKSSLPFAWLQHVQLCQVNFYSNFAPGFWSKWMVHEKWFPQCGFETLNPQPLSYEPSALTTRPRILALKLRILKYQPLSQHVSVYILVEKGQKYLESLGKSRYSWPILTGSKFGIDIFKMLITYFCGDFQTR
jgi:hypothetical protein